MKAPKSTRALPIFLSRQEYEHLLATIKADVEQKTSGRISRVSLKEGEVLWLLGVVPFAVGTGFRIGELCNLRWSAVDLEHHYVDVRNEEGFVSKSGHERRVPVAGDALEVLRAKAEKTRGDGEYVFLGTGGTRLSAGYVSKRFKKYARMAQLPESVTFHTLRHTYASWLVMAGVDLYRVKELLGHASIETTMRYAHLAPDSYKHDVERVFGV